MLNLDQFAKCVADSARGQYIPQHIAESLDWTKASGFDSYDLAILKVGPEHEFYWESWESILDNSEFTDSNGDSWKLAQGESGDVFLINAQGACETIQESIDARVEYEETHKDAGDSYGHMPSEGDSTDQMRRLSEYVESEFGVTLTNEQLDELHDSCLEQFAMVSRHGFASTPENEAFCLASYSVGEIEIDLQESTGHIAFDYGASDCDAYVTDSGLAYVSSDVSWRAEVARDDLKTKLEELIGIPCRLEGWSHGHLDARAKPIDESTWRIASENGEIAIRVFSHIAESRIAEARDSRITPVFYYEG